MKGLVIGCGSIGKRHLQNLKALGVGELGVVESDGERRERAARELGVATFVPVSEGLEWSPDFVVVATPTHLHLSQAIEVASGGFDLFIEKPLSHVGVGISELADAVARRSLISMVGCNMRFHPGPRKVKELLDRGAVGRILCARIYGGFYLPAWRPGTDYRDNYAAHEETGGGCILDCIHEVDLTRWYLGEVGEVFCAAGHLSSLEIATEDVAILVCRHSSGALAEVHLDYVQRTYERGCQIIGESGSIFWDFRDQRVRWYNAASDVWITFEQPGEWQLNQMYVDEMQHFLDCLRDRKPTMLPVSEGAAVMQIVFAAKASAREGKTVATGSHSGGPAQ
jgi:predicted dehydrogenase